MDAKELQRRADRADVEIDTQTMARVVESLVIRGDISGLSPEERSRFYVQMCDSLGLNASAQPFAILKLNGKEILYPNRGATDQLAAIHRLTREVVEGPEVRDFGGTKLVYCKVRATHPNGRSETAVATVPVADMQMALMKCETKGKRRATLAILGLALLDETEVESIPARHKQIVAQIEVPAEPSPPAVAGVPTALASFLTSVEQIDLPGEAVAVWIRYRAELATLSSADCDAAWKALCKRTEEVGKMKNAKVWLKRAIAEEDARRPWERGTGGATPQTGEAQGAEDQPLTVEEIVLAALTALDLADDHGPTLAQGAQIYLDEHTGLSQEDRADLHARLARHVGCSTAALKAAVVALGVLPPQPPAQPTMDDELVRAALEARTGTELEHVAARARAQMASGGDARKRFGAVYQQRCKELGVEPTRGPRGGAPRPAPTAAVDEDPERDAIQAEDAAAAPVALDVTDAQLPAAQAAGREANRMCAALSLITPAQHAGSTTGARQHVANHVADHEHEYDLPRDEATRLAVARIIELGDTEMQAMNRLRAARQTKTRARRSAA